MPWLLLLLGACAFEHSEGWHGLLVPDSPCYRVDLSDGLSEEDTAELKDLFACLDQGNLTPLAPLVEAMDTQARGGRPAGLELTALVNHIATSQGIWPGALFLATTRTLAGPDAPLATLPHMLVELAYGVTFPEAAARGPANTQGAIDAGVLAPLLPLTGRLASIILDEDLAPMGPMADLADSSLARDVVFTMAAAEETGGGSMDLLLNLPAWLGRTYELSLDETNDHWAGASGGSIRDLAVALVGSDPRAAMPAEELIPALAALVDDGDVRDEIKDWLRLSYEGGELSPLAAELHRLASVGVDGGTLQPGAISALASLARLLHDGNRRVSCSLWGLELGSVDNLSTWLLTTIARQDPDTVRSALDVGGTVLTWETLIDALAGQCTVSDTFSSDVRVLERLMDEEADEVLPTTLGALRAFYAGGEPGRLPELVDLLSLLHALDLVDPALELMKDVHAGRLERQAISILPPLLDPWGESRWCAEGVPACWPHDWGGYEPDGFPGDTGPVTLDTLLDLPAACMEHAGGGESCLTPVRPLLVPTLSEEALWNASAALSALVTDQGSELASAMTVLPPWLAQDPDLSAVTGVARLMRDPHVTTPALRLLETEAVLTTLTRTSPEQEGPMPFGARLITSDTLVEVLRTVGVVLELLEEPRQ